MNAGRDPYRVEPLRACEHRRAAAMGYDLMRDVTIPAPLPPYDLALFRPMALLPESIAESLLTLIDLLFGIGTIVAIVRLGPARPLPTAVLVAVDGLYIALLTGQISLIAIGAAVCAALALDLGRPRLAAALTATTLFEPHIGGPVVIAALLFVPTMRRQLVLCLAVLAIVTLASLPLGETVEYLRDVVPLHVASEARFPGQFSIVQPLVARGADPRSTVRAAELFSFVALAFGLLAAKRIARGARDPLLLLVPFACAVVGGPYIHLAQIAAATPALVVLARRDTVPRADVALALTLVAIPWTAIDDNATAALAAAAFAATIGLAAITTARLRLVTGMPIVLAGAAYAVYVGAHPTSQTFDHAALAARLTTTPPTAYASAAWRIFIDGTAPADPAAGLAARLPTWIGLLTMLIAFARTPTGRLRPAGDVGGTRP